jgi:hypothetical protein
LHAELLEFGPDEYLYVPIFILKLFRLSSIFLFILMGCLVTNVVCAQSHTADSPGIAKILHSQEHVKDLPLAMIEEDEYEAHSGVHRKSTSPIHDSYNCRVLTDDIHDTTCRLLSGSFHQNTFLFLLRLRI